MTRQQQDKTKQGKDQTQTKQRTDTISKLEPSTQRTRHKTQDTRDTKDSNDSLMEEFKPIQLELYIYIYIGDSTWFRTVQDLQ